MSDVDVSPTRFGAAFKAFMEAVIGQAAPPGFPTGPRRRAGIDTSG